MFLLVFLVVSYTTWLKKTDPFDLFVNGLQLCFIEIGSADLVGEYLGMLMSQSVG